MNKELRTFAARQHLQHLTHNANSTLQTPHYATAFFREEREKGREIFIQINAICSCDTFCQGAVRRFSTLLVCLSLSSSRCDLVVTTIRSRSLSLSFSLSLTLTLTALDLHVLGTYIYHTLSLSLSNKIIIAYTGYRLDYNSSSSSTFIVVLTTATLRYTTLHYDILHKHTSYT